VLLSGGTSKGEGDLNQQVVSELDPGVIVHGVALKPGKPICLAAAGRQPVAVLPASRPPRCSRSTSSSRR
jgi:putative molybdopterin biosynthesis protein